MYSSTSLSVNYIVQGQGQPVVLIHGIAASLFDWNYLTPDLAASGYAAYALDLFGHGDSAKPDDPAAYHIETLYQHFSTWLEALNLTIPPLIVGHSMGAYLGLMHALRNPGSVRGLVLVDPFYTPLQLSPVLKVLRHRPLLGEKALRIIPEWLVHTAIGLDPITMASFTPESRRQIAVDYKRASPHFVYITRDIPDLSPQLSRVTAPVLVIWGEQDQTLQPASFARLAHALPNAQGHSIPSCGHQPHIGQPLLVNQLTLEFFSKIGLP